MSQISNPKMIKKKIKTTIVFYNWCQFNYDRLGKVFFILITIDMT